MENEEEIKAVEAVTRLFYEGIEAGASGRGADLIAKAWHHSDRVTSRHPVDTWSVGWAEIWETWKFMASFGGEGRGGTSISELRCYVYGDAAYATVIFHAAKAWGGQKLMCTDVLAKIDGEWKLVHHHADPSPKMGEEMERIAQEG